MKIIYSFFGIHTLDEFRHFFHQAMERVSQGHVVIALLGTLPPHVTLNLSFISDVILLETDNTPAMDVEDLQTTMKIGLETPVRLYRLILASSFEVEFLVPNSNILREFHSFSEGAINTLLSYLLYGDLHTMIDS